MASAKSLREPGEQMNRRKFVVALGIVIATLFIYSRWIEPSWIEVTRHQVFASTERPLKIIQLSDLHTYEFGAREKKVLEIIRREEPDTILISGDTIANEGDWKSVSILLSRLRAPLGVFLVRGNWEHWRPDPDELKVYESSGVTFLNNEARPLSENTWVVGLDDSFVGVPDQRGAFGTHAWRPIAHPVFTTPLAAGGFGNLRGRLVYARLPAYVREPGSGQFDSRDEIRLQTRGRCFSA